MTRCLHCNVPLVQIVPGGTWVSKLTKRSMCHSSPSFRHVNGQPQVEHESPADPPQFVAVRRLVMRGVERIAEAASHTMAKRIARALNNHTPNSKGY